MPQGFEWVVILILAAIVFLRRPLLNVMEAMGRGVAAFAKGLREAQDDGRRFPKTSTKAGDSSESSVVQKRPSGTLPFAIALCLVIVVAVIFIISLTPSSPSARGTSEPRPVTAPSPKDRQASDQFEAAKQRTFAAWQALQDADAVMGRRRDLLPSELCRETGYMYARINLDGVDDILVNHLKKSVDVCQKGTALWPGVEKDLSDIQEGLDELALLAALLAAKDDPDAALLAALLADDVQEAAAKEFDRKWGQALAAWVAAQLEVVQGDKVVAEKLTQKYGVQFIDAF